MATGPEHYRAAEKLLELAKETSFREIGTDFGIAALAHAQLAVAAATAMAGDLSSPNQAAWTAVAGEPAEAADARRRAAAHR